MEQKILIAYFSHDGEAYVGGEIRELKVGNTRAAAQMIEHLTGGELLRIETVESYPYAYMETVEKAQAELKANARPELKTALPQMDAYDTVILGYPNWWGTMPMAVCGFLEECDLFGKRILPFCTHEGSGMGRSETDIQRLCPGAKVEKGLAITGSRVGGAERQIAKWLKDNKVIN